MLQFVLLACREINFERDFFLSFFPPVFSKNLLQCMQ